MKNCIFFVLIALLCVSGLLGLGFVNFLQPKFILNETLIISLTSIAITATSLKSITSLYVKYKDFELKFNNGTKKAEDVAK